MMAANGKDRRSAMGPCWLNWAMQTSKRDPASLSPIEKALLADAERIAAKAFNDTIVAERISDAER